MSVCVRQSTKWVLSNTQDLCECVFERERERKKEREREREKTVFVNRKHEIYEFLRCSFFLSFIETKKSLTGSK